MSKLTEAQKRAVELLKFEDAQLGPYGDIWWAGLRRIRKDTMDALIRKNIVKTYNDGAYILARLVKEV